MPLARPARRKRGAKAILRLLLRLLAALFLLGALAVALLPFALRLPAVQRKLLAIAQQETARYTPYKVSFERISLSNYSRLVIAGLTVHDQNGFFARIARVEAGSVWGALLARPMALDEARLEGLEGTLTRCPDGLWNIARWEFGLRGKDRKPARIRPKRVKTRKGEPRGIPVTIRRVFIRDAKVKVCVANDGEPDWTENLVLNVTAALLPREVVAHEARVTGKGLRVETSGTVGLVRPYALNAAATVEAEDLARYRAVAPRLPALKNAKAYMETKGPAKDLAFTVRASADPAQTVSGTVRLSFENGLLLTQDLALASLDPLSLGAGFPGELTGTVKGRFTLSRDSAWEAELRAALPASRMFSGAARHAAIEARGNGSLEGARPFKAEARVALESPLLSKGGASRVSGTCRADGVLAGGPRIGWNTGIEADRALWGENRVKSARLKAAGTLLLGETRDLEVHAALMARDVAFARAEAERLTLTAETRGWPALDQSFQTDASLDVEDAVFRCFRAARAQARVQGNGAGKGLVSLTAKAFGGELSLAADGDFSGLAARARPVAITCNGTLTGVNPALVSSREPLPGGVDGAWTVQAEKAEGVALAGTRLTADVTLGGTGAGKVHLSGGALKAKYADGVAVVEQLALAWKDGGLQAKGRTDLAGKGEIDLKVRADDLAAPTAWFLPAPVPGTLVVEARVKGDFPALAIEGDAWIQGKLPDLAPVTAPFLPAPVTGSLALDARLSAKGDARDPEVQGTLEADAPAFQGQGAESLSISFAGRPASLAVTARLAAKNARFFNTRLDSLDADTRLAGADRLVFSAKAKGPDFALETRGEANALNQRQQQLQFDLVKAALKGRAVANQGPVLVRFEPGTVRIERLTLAGAPGAASLVGFYGTEGASDLRLTAKGLDLGPVTRFFRPGADTQGVLDVDARASGTRDAPVLSLDIQVRGVRAGKGLPGANLRASASYRDGTASSKGSLSPEQGGVCDWEAVLPVSLARPLPQDWPPRSGFAGALNCRELNLSFLPALAPQLKEIHAVLDLSARAAGDPLSPDIRGTARLLGTKLVLRDWQTPFTKAALDARFELGVIRLARLGLATGDKGTVEVSGALVHQGFRPRSVNAKLAARGLRVVRQDQVEALAGADLALTGEIGAPRLTGEITVEKGELRLDRYLRARDREVVVVEEAAMEGKRGGKPASGIWDSLSVDGGLRLAGPFWIKGAGAQIELGGGVRVKKAPGQSSPALEGAIRAVRGYYTFQGKTFAVREGAVTFIGVTPPVPNIAIVTRYDAPGGELVYLTIGGTSEKVTLALSSEPAMEQTDILSVLLFGERATRLGKGQAQTLQSRAVALLGSQVLAELKDTFGEEAPVDLITLQESGTGESKDSLVLGKYLSPRLFVIYKRGIAAQGENTLKLEYKLTEHFNVESEVSDTKSGLDVFWTHEY
jgi:translocation and assembly module TamB